MRFAQLASVLLTLAASVALRVLPVSAAESPHSIPGFLYVSPAPNSELHRPQTNIIVRPVGIVDPSSLVDGVITATGSFSGDHPGTLRLSDDGETIVFQPTARFTDDETVTCTIAPGIRTDLVEELPGATFSFQISPPFGQAVFDAVGGNLADRLGWTADPYATPVPEMAPAARLDSIPGLPEFQLSVTGPTAPGDLFVSDIRFDNPLYKSHLMILRNDGTPAFQKPLLEQGLDFKLQPHQRWLTYFDGDRGRYYALNANHAVVDSFTTGNGYPIDLHELILLPNGHALLMSYDPQRVDMSAVVEGGNPNAIVVGLVVQELDLVKDVVFQWRSWDHFQITDGVRSLLGANVDYAHGNSIEPDLDGNLIFSSRHMDEITKVSRQTGAILWRLGGKNNQFTFVNDPDRFHHQHSARRLANGHLLLYDNGNFHTPPYSRAVEYALDEENLTATLVWQYRNTPEVFGGAMGSVQRLPNGNTIIGWGSTNPSATEVTPEGVKVAELNLPTGTYSYRAFRFEWPPRLTIAPRIESGTIDISKKEQHLEIRFSSDEFAVHEVDFETLRLNGLWIPVEIRYGDPIPAPGRGRLASHSTASEVKVTFAVEPLLPYLKSGAQHLTLSGKLTSGETFTGSVPLKVSGERSARARLVSPVGAFPLQLAVRATGVPRQVAFEAHDVHGRRVAGWTATSDGSGVVSWDGRASDGERLRSGIYFVGTKGSALQERVKLVVVK